MMFADESGESREKNLEVEVCPGKKRKNVCEWEEPRETFR